MADISDVGAALLSLIEQATYPNGTLHASVIGHDVIIYEGWPDPQELAAGLAAGQVHVSVFPRPGDRQIDTLTNGWKEKVPVNLTLSASSIGNTLTIGGTVSVPQNMVAIVEGIPYLYAVQPADTLATVAAGVAAAITNKAVLDQSFAAAAAAKSYQITVNGAVLTVGGATRVSATAGGAGKIIKEQRRQARVMQISIWAQSHALRDAMAKPLDAALAAVSRITLADGTYGTLRYSGSAQIDDLQKQGIYKRDLLYEVSYGVTTEQDTATIIVPTTNITRNLP